MTKARYDAVKADLSSRIKGLRCTELVGHLESLGFKVKKGSKGNHHTYSHPDLKSFHGSNFDCGHGKNPILKPAYVRRAIAVLEEYESELFPTEESIIQSPSKK